MTNVSQKECQGQSHYKGVKNNNRNRKTRELRNDLVPNNGFEASLIYVGQVGQILVEFDIRRCHVFWCVRRDARELVFVVLGKLCFGVREERRRKLGVRDDLDLCQNLNNLTVSSN